MTCGSYLVGGGSGLSLLLGLLLTLRREIGA